MTIIRINENGESIFKTAQKSNCGQKSVKCLQKKLPIIEWLPKYSRVKLMQDSIAGLTVGLTAIPQGIAYAVVAGLSPEYGLYGGLLGGVVYCIFGGCKDIIIGPTAILAALVGKYVTAYSFEFAVLASFISGIVMCLFGILRLGFLVEFISMPVIKGFTNGAALQIAGTQLKSLFGTNGGSGDFFAESVYLFVKNISTIRWWNFVLGVATIIILIFLKWLGKGCSRNGNAAEQTKWFISLSRYGIVIIIAMGVAYIIDITTVTEPLVLVGDIQKGLPKIQLPPFTTVVGNTTYSFVDMLEIFSTSSIIIPLISILEAIAIGKAFADGKPVDASQEMLALGLCNIAGSFISSMPVTGSFTKTVLNHASGVQTTVGGLVASLIVLLGLSLLTSLFYYIPKAALAGLILTAMYSMMEFAVILKLWKQSKRELLILIATMLVCMAKGLEYGIIAGVALEALMMIYRTSRPSILVQRTKIKGKEAIAVTLPENMFYCTAEYLRRSVLGEVNEEKSDAVVVIDGTTVRKIDITVAVNLVEIIKDLHNSNYTVKLLNFSTQAEEMCLVINPKLQHLFVKSVDLDSISIE